MSSPSASHPKAVLLNSIGFDILNYLEAHPDVRNVEMVTKEGLLPAHIAAWERKNVPYCLSRDLKGFYSCLNGLFVKWYADMGGSEVVVGEMRINSIEALIRVPIDIKFPQTNGYRVDAAPLDPQTCAAYLLDSFCEFGNILLVFRAKVDYAGIAEPEVWFQDHSGGWHFIASTFKQYFRLLLLHLGVIGWQMFFTPEGPPQFTMQWMRHFCRERLCIDLHSAAQEASN